MTFSIKMIPPESWLGNPRYELLSPITVNGHVIPEGFQTDGATVPRILSLLGAIFVLISLSVDIQWMGWLGLLCLIAVAWFPSLGRYAKAAILHDYLLIDRPYDRHFADKEFLKAMESLEIEAWRREIMFIAVYCWSEVMMFWHRHIVSPGS